MTSATKTQKELLAENEVLRLRLEEAEETLRAIGSGEVDAFVVSRPEGEQQVFTLKGAEQPYRILVESMNEGAATIAADGTILYCNKRLSTMLKIPLENLVGTKLGTYVAPKDYLTYTALLENCTQESMSEEIAMTTEAGNSIPVFMSCCANDISGTQGISIVVTDLTLQRRNSEILASEKFSTSIIEQSSEAMIVCDAQGKIIRASQSAHALCGTNPLLKQFNKIYPLQFTETGKKFSIVQLMRAGNVTSIEVEFKRDDEQIFNLLLNATTLRSLQNLAIGYVVNLTDITGRKTAEMELHQSEVRLQSAYSHLQVVNKELQVASEELQAQGEELKNQNQELQELWKRSKQSEEALAAAHRQIQNIVDNTPAIVYAFDPEGRFVLANAAIAKLLNSTPARMIGKRRHDFMPQADADWHEANDRKVIEAGEALEFEEQSELPDRSITWLTTKYPLRDAAGKIYAVGGISTDITERKNAEMTLQESEQRIQQALYVSRSFTFDWSPASDQVKRSASCVAILNLTGDEAVIDTGEHFFQTVHPDDRARLVQILRDLTPTADTYITEYRYVRNDGSEITLEETGRASFDASGKMLRLVGVSTDITLRKNAELALKIAYDKLELRIAERTKELVASIDHLQSEILERESAEKKLLEETTIRIQAMEALREKEQMLIQQSRQAAMGEMISNIAHQWRQPLNALGLFTQQLGYCYGTPRFDKSFLDSSVAKSMEIIQHMSKTIDDFRDYFKPEKEKADFYVIKAINNTLSLLEGNFNNPKITIDLVAHDNPVINGYQNEFAQVFLNILNNARDAMLERKITDGRIIITISSDNNCAVVTVADNAGGIPDEVITKVFDPYFTTKGPQSGTGIGLFMSKTIIEKNMGGRLAVRNTDTGAEFRIEVEQGAQN